jgi:hypothetical protein
VVEAKVTPASTGRTVLLKAHDDVCPVPTIYYRISGGSTVKRLTSVTFDISDSQSVEYWAEDSSYNVSTHKTIPALTGADTTPPTVTATVTPVAAGRDVSLTAVDDRSTATISYRVNGGAVVATAKASVSVNLAIADTLEYWAVDGSGNASAHRLIASAAPSVKLTATPLTVTYPAMVTLTAAAANPETTTATFQVHYESEPEGKWTTIYSATLEAGRFVLYQIPPKRAYYKVIVGSVEASANVYVHAGMSKPRANTTKIRVGRALSLSGTIKPKHPAGQPAADTTYRVRFWKYNAATKQWKETGSMPWKIAKVLDNDTSQWSYSRRFSSSQVGLWRVAFFHSCPRHRAASSPTLQFSVVK